MKHPDNNILLLINQTKHAQVEQILRVNSMRTPSTICRLRRGLPLCRISARQQRLSTSIRR